MDAPTTPHIPSNAALAEDRAARLLADIGSKYLERLALDDELAMLPPTAPHVQASDLHQRRVATDAALVNLRAQYARLTAQEPA